MTAAAPADDDDADTAAADGDEYQRFCERQYLECADESS
jgi:hypothetical protein